MKKRRTQDVGRFKSGTIIGILGHPWRATVDKGGNVFPWDDSPPLRWYIAAEDRWHLPAEEVATRQVTIEGTPVLETRVRVPQGDVIQRVWVAPGREVGPAVIVEFENDSARAVAIAVSRADVIAPRAALDIGSLTVGPDALAPHEAVLGLPLGHRTRIRITLSCQGTDFSGSSAVTDHGEYVSRFSDWSDVVRGWTALSERASRIVVPDIVSAVLLSDAVTTERCQVALDPPCEFADPISATQSLIAWRDLLRMGLDSPDLENVISAVEVVARDLKRRADVSADTAHAIMAAAYLLHNVNADDQKSIGETRQDLIRDLVRVVERAVGRSEKSLPKLVYPFIGLPSRSVELLEGGLVSWSDDGEATLCPDGLSENRLGANIEAHGVVVGPEHRVSFALRWHGALPAVIWEVAGPPGLRLRSGVDAAWSSTDATGEALWRMEVQTSPPSETVSFS